MAIKRLIYQLNGKVLDKMENPYIQVLNFRTFFPKIKFIERVLSFLFRMPGRKFKGNALLNIRTKVLDLDSLKPRTRQAMNP